MQETQTKARRGVRSASSLPTVYCPLPIRPAFTLTELLVVIAIIAVLAGLIAAAAVNALENANRNRIALEIRNISASVEEFKNDYGAYPPNGMNPDAAVANPAPGTPAALIQADFERMFKKAFPHHQEPRPLIRALCGQNYGATDPKENLENGLTAAEALCFWLGGFSADEQYPISGPGGPSFNDVGGDQDGTLEASDEQLEGRNRRYEFDIARLGPRNDDDIFDDGADRGRFLLYEFTPPGGTLHTRRINLWRYAPPGSEQPLVYFDASRYKPGQYDLWAVNPDTPAPYIFAFKQLRSGTQALPKNPTDFRRSVVFVNQGKFQLLHAGLDDAWGEDFERMSLTESLGGWGYADFSNNPMLLYPDGPFIGDIADTLTNFTDGTIEDAAEE